MTHSLESSRRVRIAATADLHVGADDADRVAAAFAKLDECADLALFAGDLTQHGEVDEARIIAEGCRRLLIPVVAILGNHDWHSDRASEIVKTLSEAGVIVLDRAHTILPLAGTTIGIVGVKGFVGGFGNGWANFGEPLFREAYRETTLDVEALDKGLRAIAGCGVRVALLHYSPSEQTLVGEPERLWLVLGAERLAEPIREHHPHLVVHGHAHHGSFEGSIDGVPVHNVAVHVTGKDFWVFELDAAEPREPVVVEQA
jgi:Icc-related predicted phosphoesterase